MAVDERTTGTAMVEALVANGVDLVFGIPGTHNLELYRGINRSPIRHVVTRHEQGATYAADGYARATGRVGVVITTSGPGLTNALTGMANAYADSVPLLVVSPGVPTGLERQDHGILHEAKDQRAAADNLVARSVRPGTPRQAVDAVHEAFSRWRTERPRPVHLEVPLDVLEQPWTGDVAAWPAPHPAGLAPEQVESIADLLCAARPVFIAGGGAVDAADDVTALAEAVDAPVLTTTLGKGVIDESHPLSAGPFYGARGSEQLVGAAGVVLALGTELGRFDESYGGFDGTLVRIDIDPAQLHKNRRADVAAHSDVRTAVSALRRAVSARSPHHAEGTGASLAAGVREAWRAAAGPRRRKYEAIQTALARALPADVVVTGDSSQVSYLGTDPYWRFDRPRRYLVTTGYSTLGYAVPAAIGAKLAFPDRAVIALLGDGALMFSVQELMTAAELGLSLPIVVVDNDGFGEIRDNMLDRDIKPLAVTLRQPDFVGLATAMGCHGVLVHSEAEAADAAAAGLTAGRPSLVVLRSGH